MRIFPLSNNVSQPIPLFMSRIPAGNPSHDDSDALETLDFNVDILTNPETSVYALVEGDSMVDVGIVPGTVLLIDREAEVQDGCIAVLIINGERTVKRVERHGASLRLISENRNYEPIELDPTQNLEVFGVVQYSIRCHKLSHSSGIFRVR